MAHNILSLLNPQLAQQAYAQMPELMQDREKQRGWKARLFDRLTPNGADPSLDDKSRRAAINQGLLALAAGIQSSPNLGEGLTQGLLAASQGLSGARRDAAEAADKKFTREYNLSTMRRTQANEQRESEVRELQGRLFDANGQMDMAVYRKLAALAPEAATASRTALQGPQPKYSLSTIEMGGYKVPVYVDESHPGTVLDLTGKPVSFGGQPAAPTPGIGAPLVDMVSSIIEPLGGRITSTTGGKHNVGSLHPSGRAVDIGMAQESPEQQEAILSALRADPSLKVVDERQRPAGQKVWSGPHLHVEAGQSGASADSPFAALPGATLAVKPKQAAGMTPYQQESLALRREALQTAVAARKDAGDAKKQADAIVAASKLSAAKAPLAAAVQTAQDSIDAVDKLRSSEGYNLLGTELGDIQIGTPFIRNPTKDANAQLDNVVSRTVAGVMADMKSQSRTGATGFGALNKEELKILQTSAQNLDRGQLSHEALDRNLTDLVEMLRRNRDRVAARLEELSANNAAAPSSEDDALVQKWLNQ